MLHSSHPNNHPNDRLDSCPDNCPKSTRNAPADTPSNARKNHPFHGSPHAVSSAGPAKSPGQAQAKKTPSLPKSPPPSPASPPHRARRKAAPRLIFYLTVFVFALVTAACRSFFGTYPFGVAVVSALSGLFGAGCALLGSVAGSLLSSASYGGFLALLSVLLFVARLVLSFWMKMEPNAKSGNNRGSSVTSGRTGSRRTGRQRSVGFLTKERGSGFEGYARNQSDPSGLLESDGSRGAGSAGLFGMLSGRRARDQTSNEDPDSFPLPRSNRNAAGGKPDPANRPRDADPPREHRADADSDFGASPSLSVFSADGASAFVNKETPTDAVAFVQFVARVAFQADGTLFHESVLVRMALGALATFFLGAMEAAEGGFTYLSLFGAVFAVMLSPIAVYFFYAATERHMRVSPAREAGIYAMAAVFAYALSSISPPAFNFGFAFTFAFSLMAALQFGSVRGMVTGLLSGLLLEPVFAPLFALSAGICGLLSSVSVQLAIFSGFSSAIAWGIYVSGFSALVKLVPPIAIACAILLPAAYFNLLHLPDTLFGLTRNVREAEHGTLAEVMHRETARRLERLAGSAKAVAQVVSTLAGKLQKPTRYELRELCEDAFDRFCGRCPSRGSCYGSEYRQTAALTARLTEELFQTGAVSAGTVSRNFAKKCCSIGRILDEINFQAARRCALAASEDKLSVVAGDYEMMGELLSECLRSDRDETEEDRVLTAKLTRLLAYHDFRVGRVTAYGVRHKRIFASDVDLTRLRLGGDDIRRLFEGICGFPLSEPEFEIDGAVISMRIHSVYAYAAVCGRASLSASDVYASYETAELAVQPTEATEAIEATEEKTAGGGPKGRPVIQAISFDKTTSVLEAAEEKPGSSPGVAEGADGSGESGHGPMEETVKASASVRKDEPSGDAISTFEADGRMYMLISDGMGSGREASLTSSMAAMFLERMLTAGASMETALKMLNKLLRAGERECSATIDLCEIDLKTGRAKFVKSGAAPSFVIRDGCVYRLQSKTVPIGIIRALDAEMIQFDVEAGDTVVMVSDGVARSFEECPWLLDLLSTDGDVLRGETSVAAEKIVRQAAERGSRDDITAGVIRICAAG